MEIVLTPFEAQNRAWWNERVPYHVESDFYDIEKFKQTRDSLMPIEIREVGDVSGKSLVHLQCHFGQDTLSWAARGAQVTGVDFSEPAITAARALAQSMDLPAEFVLSDVYHAPLALKNKTFDVVFTSYGTIYWLQDLKRWAQAIRALLKPGGFFYIAEFHPFLYVFSENDLDGLKLGYPYFDAAEPLELDEEPGSYANRAAPTLVNRHYGWQHGVGAILNALIGAGLQIEFFNEHREAVCAYFKSDKGRQADGFWRIPYDLPQMFSIRARVR